jgi:hypothetical protein
MPPPFAKESTLRRGSSLGRTQILSGPRSIPNEGALGSVDVVVSARHVPVRQHALGGTLPRQFGLLSTSIDLLVCTNILSGPIPTEFGSVSAYWGCPDRLDGSPSRLPLSLPSELARLPCSCGAVA